jgi:DNA invertase Pin-like site-specific DNA recombinase
VSNLIGYLRVSTEKQKKSGLGIKAQRTQLLTWAKANGHTIIAWEQDEAKSGKSTDGREGLDRAIQACKAGLADGIVIALLDRLIRNVADYHRLRTEAAADGYKLIALEFAGMDPDEPMTAFMEGIGALRAQYDRQVISVRTKQALAELKAQGVKLGRPHSQPVSLRKYARRCRAEGYTVDETYAMIRQKSSKPPSRATVARMMNDDSIALPNIAAEAIHANGRGAP